MERKWYYIGMNIVAVMTIILGSYIAVIHALALFFELYWRYWWFDSVVHIFGGAFIVFALATLVSMSWLPKRYGEALFVKRILLAVIIGWEIFGIILIGGLKDGFFVDTSLDIVFGVLGGVIGYRLIKRLRKIES